ncbi:helix-turn-helix domain-containing protein [Corynebacterium sp. CCM 9185]|uniref:Helix-turn-helix domain-containing protein n=1 Tax=Corynebacterium marambiense TaxID=2765364 RepID=A0ABS0VXE9_9CORY|nr:helix-turn-helix domain-containing protein [Corynebacterium marambiense]MBI9000048.1 helix-turn-helix domain-containing protein [Corynebacterium marambiense]MCK7663400.1 helix-turn-helix domain-containing protein [Corynebacterium marambiense]
MSPVSRPTITVEEAAAVLGISKSSAYAAIKRNEFPTPVIKIGGRYVVPTAPLRQLLGVDAPKEAA